MIDGKRGGEARGGLRTVGGYKGGRSGRKDEAKTFGVP